MDNEEKLIDPVALASWMQKIKNAEDKYKDYHALIDTIRSYYKNNKSKNINNLFWSSIETLKPFLYFKTPKPYIERKDKAADPVGAMACKILERALEWNLSQFDFDSVIKYVRNDFLLTGMGICYEKYVPAFKTISHEPLVEVVEKEQINTAYISPKDLIADTDNVNVWEDVTWVARKINMTCREIGEQFGKDVAKLIDFNDDNKRIRVYEIWDKSDRTIKYLCREVPERFLKIAADYLHLEGFFPFPKPVFATLSNDGVIPVPDYVQIKRMLSEMDGINERMRLTMQALKVSGVYDNSFSRLADIFDKDVTLVSVSDFDRLKEAGGIRGAIDFIPIEQYITALRALAERRQDLSNQIYEITGVSDIMRGNSNQVETATAVTKKTNFGTLRNQDRQNDMQRFITDLLRIKAEMICELFDPQTLAFFAGEVEPDQKAIVQQAIAVLKADKMRDMVLGIETDVSFKNEETTQKTVEAITLMNEMIVKAFEVVSNQPHLLPLYRQMLESVVVTLPAARQYENVIEKVFDSISQELKS